MSGAAIVYMGMQPSQPRLIVVAAVVVVVVVVANVNQEICLNFVIIDIAIIDLCLIKI